MNTNMNAQFSFIRFIICVITLTSFTLAGSMIHSVPLALAALDTNTPLAATVVTQNAPASPVAISIEMAEDIDAIYPGDTIRLAVYITNTSDGVIDSLPFSYTYGPLYQSFVRAEPAADENLTPNSDIGQLRWDNLTDSLTDDSSSGLGAGESIEIQLEFVAGLDTEKLTLGGTTRNVAVSGNADANIRFTVSRTPDIAVEDLIVDRPDTDVTILWRTTDETNITSFIILRYSNIDTEKAVLTEPEILAINSGEPTGNSYDFVDTTMDPQPGSKYQYVLDVHMTDGSSNQLNLGLVDIPAAQSTPIPGGVITWPTAIGTDSATEGADEASDEEQKWYVYLPILMAE
ncbi:MAG: hypothetical protein AAF639_45690 [Chloroflexota bacterium]